ncbi:MAG: LysR family transcriptional regulator [Anaerolineaceae bacterium]|nr:MAG: LysR family transcriptional regulator [Anaerolineaceae bacterium]
MDINLEYYKIFYYVAKEGSFTKAGEEMCISQPAVSQSIKLLEDSLGTKLFMRLPKGVKLTPEGEALYSYVKRGYEFIKLGEEQFQKMLDLEHGEIRIGASDMTLQYYLLPFLERFHEKYPGIKVIVTNGPTPNTLALLYDGKIDFGVVSEPFQVRAAIKYKKVKKIRDIFVAGSRFQDLKGKTMEYKDLERLPIISLEHNTSTRKYVNEYLESNQVVLNPEFELATSDMIVKFAMRNLGIGCVVKDFAKEALENEYLFELQFIDKVPERSICIVMSKQNPISEAANKLLEMLNTL